MIPLLHMMIIQQEAQGQKKGLGMNGYFQVQPKPINTGGNIMF